MYKYHKLLTSFVNYLCCYPKFLNLCFLKKYTQTCDFFTTIYQCRQAYSIRLLLNSGPNKAPELMLTSYFLHFSRDV